EQREPPRPDFSLKGRTPASLLKLVREWHGSLGQAKQPHAQWCESGIVGFQFIEESGGIMRVWTITELLDSHTLVHEGRLMHHCVATYVSSCLHGKSSIWSMEVEKDGERQKMLTVEVDPAQRVICQARGKRNELPTEKCRDILRRWASQAGLQLAEHV
ncbi:MAG TPA: PcfJ domain-containing protein, partial [Gemmataceae bacterium]|nr:PcfJ domain-containing protein [Gemmataceae bacterium]